MATPSVELVFEPGVDTAAARFVADSLSLYNVAVTGFEAYWPATFLLRTPRGEILGGLVANIWGGWMHVRETWVSQPLRRTGHGRKLLRAAEAMARERGCVGVHLETFSFQARPFYEKEGYRVYATLPDCPVGHAHYMLAKRFDRAALAPRGIAPKPMAKKRGGQARSARRGRSRRG